MDTGRIRRELVASIRMPAVEERLLVAGLLAGALAYPIWLAGTGVALDRAAAALGPVGTDPWTTETTGLLAALAVLWVVVPALAATWFVRREVTNVRGNLARGYRFEHPALLLLPPLALAGAVVAVAAVREAVALPVAAAFAAASFLFLVRTVAFGYRAYAASVPRVLQFLLFLGAAAIAVPAAVRGAALTDQAALIEAAAGRYGVASYAFGTSTYVGYDIPALPVAGAAVPLALGLAYLLVQSLAATVVRIRRPDVPRSKLRPGQRYPAAIHPAADVSSPSAGPVDGQTVPEPPAEATGDASSGAGASQSGGGSDRSSGIDRDDGADRAGAPDQSNDEHEETVESVGQTRVFTPPDDDEWDDPAAAGGAGGAGDDPLDSGTSGGPLDSDRADDPLDSGPSASDPIADETAVDGAAGADTAVDGRNAGSASDAETASGDEAVDSEYCPICGEQFASDPDRTNCPNCHAELDD